MKFSDEVLMACADGELEGELRAEVQQAIRTDPEVARKIAEFAALRCSVRDAFAGVVNEPVPMRLVAAVDAAARGSSVAASHGSSKGVPQRPARRVRLSLPQWAALAASFLLGIGVWQLIGRRGDLMLIERGGHLVAAGALTQALSNQLVSEQTGEPPVQIGISFRSKSGNYCRTFQVRSDSYAGMACRDGEGWQVQMLGRSEGASINSVGYRQAASAFPPWLVQQVDGVIAGEPLDAQTEARARARDWH